MTVPASPLNMQLPIWNILVATALAQFPIYVQQDRGSRTSFHKQPGVEIHITHEGQASLFAFGRPLQQLPRQVTILSGNIPHQLVSDSSLPYLRTVICVDTSEFSTLKSEKLASLFNLDWLSFGTGYSFRLIPETFADVEDLCRLMLRESQRKDVEWQRMLLAYLMELLVLLQRGVEADKIEQQLAQHTGDGVSSLVQRCVQYIHQHLDEKLPLTHVASYFKVSPEHLTRTFKRELNVTFHQYVMTQRIEVAKRQLLSHPDLTITDVALSLGFGSTAHFSRCFRRVAQESASAYRRARASR